MALSDILARIDSDAAAEAQQVAEEASREVGATLAQARRAAEKARDEAHARTSADAIRQAETLVANARLKARDTLLGAKRELVERALQEAAARFAALPDDRYAEVLAKRVAASARGGERVLFAPADRDRLRERLPKAVAKLAPGTELSYDDEPAPMERGVVLAGGRVREEVSPASMLASRRDELASLVASILFAEEAQA